MLMHCSSQAHCRSEARGRCRTSRWCCSCAGTGATGGPSRRRSVSGMPAAGPPAAAGQCPPPAAAQAAPAVPPCACTGVEGVASSQRLSVSKTSRYSCPHQQPPERRQQRLRAPVYEVTGRCQCFDSFVQTCVEGQLIEQTHARSSTRAGQPHQCSVAHFWWTRRRNSRPRNIGNGLRLRGAHARRWLLLYKSARSLPPGCSAAALTTSSAQVAGLPPALNAAAPGTPCRPRNDADVELCF